MIWRVSHNLPVEVVCMPSIHVAKIFITSPQVSRSHFTA